MSGDLPDRPDDDPEWLAAEYALGVLDTEEHAAAAAAFAADPAFAASVAQWERRLAPLALGVPPAMPPAGLFDRIAADLPPVRPGWLVRLWRSAAFWRGATVAGLAAAAAFAAIAYLRPPEPVLTAVLTASGSGAVFLAHVQPDGAILIRPTGQVTLAPAKDLQLWALSKGATVPVSLGVLPTEGSLVNAQAQDRPDTKLLISLEPKGGSPTGQPTGPVVYGGKFDPLR